MSSYLPLETFKSNFNINADLTDVKITKITVSPYNNLEEINDEFGEKKCLLYHVELIVFNVEVILKTLAFKYDNYSEVLKLDIKICNEDLLKEMASCKNFLQRKRNMNLVFEVLIKFTELFEMRRLISKAVFQKVPYIKLISGDNGLTAKCYNNNGKLLYLELNWMISWNVDLYEVSDCIEFYFNYSVFQNNQEKKIRSKLKDLVRPQLDFQSKLRIWNSVLKDLYGDKLTVQTQTNATTVTTEILEIDDSDVEDDIIEIDQSICNEHNTDEIMVID